MGWKEVSGSYYVTVANSYTALQHIQGLSFRPEVCSSSEHESTENSFAFKKRIMKHVVCGCIIVCLSPYTSSPHITSELNPASLLRQDSISFNGNGFLSFLSNNDWGLLVWFLQQRVTGHGTLYHFAVIHYCPCSSVTQLSEGKVGRKRLHFSSVKNLSCAELSALCKADSYLSHGAAGKRHQWPRPCSWQWHLQTGCVVELAAISFKVALDVQHYSLLKCCTSARTTTDVTHWAEYQRGM